MKSIWKAFQIMDFLRVSNITEFACELYPSYKMDMILPHIFMSGSVETWALL